MHFFVLIIELVRFYRDRTSPLRLVRRDVLVDVEEILRVPLGLDLPEPLVVVAQGAAHAVVTLLLGEKVEVGAAGRELPHVPPRGTRPLDVHFVVFLLFPGRGEVDHEIRITVTDSGVIVGQLVQGTLDLKQNHRGVGRENALGMGDGLGQQRRPAAASHSWRWRRPHPAG
jgi:hypothetical protein